METKYKGIVEGQLYSLFGEIKIDEMEVVVKNNTITYEDLCNFLDNDFNVLQMKNVNQIDLIRSLIRVKNKGISMNVAYTLFLKNILLNN